MIGSCGLCVIGYWVSGAAFVFFVEGGFLPMEAQLSELAQQLVVSLTQCIFLAVERLALPPFSDASMWEVILMFIYFDRYRFWKLGEHHPIYARLLNRLVERLMTIQRIDLLAFENPLSLSSAGERLRFVSLISFIQSKFGTVIEAEEIDHIPAAWKTFRPPTRASTEILQRISTVWDDVRQRAEDVAEEVKFMPQLICHSNPLTSYEQWYTNMRETSYECCLPSPGKIVEQIAVQMVGLRQGRVSHSVAYKIRELTQKLDSNILPIAIQAVPDFNAAFAPMKEVLKEAVSFYDAYKIDYSPARTSRISAGARVVDGLLVQVSEQPNLLWKKFDFELSSYELSDILTTYVLTIQKLLFERGVLQFSNDVQPATPDPRVLYVDQFSKLDERLQTWALRVSHRLESVVKTMDREDELSIRLHNIYGVHGS